MSNLREILSQKHEKTTGTKSLSQEELALNCGLHRTYISDIECCSRNVSIDNIEKIADALNTSASELLKEE